MLPALPKRSAGLRVCRARDFSKLADRTCNRVGMIIPLLTQVPFPRQTGGDGDCPGILLGRGRQQKQGESKVVLPSSLTATWRYTGS